MAGFNNLSGEESIVNADNASFDGTERGGALDTDGQVWMGAATGNHIRKGIFTEGAGITLTYSNPNSETAELEIAMAGGGTGIDTVITDDGQAAPNGSGEINLLGLSGSQVDASGNTIIVKSPPYEDQAGSTTVALNTGSFSTNAITLTLPASAGLADGDLFEFVATNGVLVIQFVGTQIAHLGTASTSAAGTITGTATGDSISLRYQASTNDFWATSSIGTWVLA